MVYSEKPALKESSSAKWIPKTTPNGTNSTIGRTLASSIIQEEKRGRKQRNLLGTRVKKKGFVWKGLISHTGVLGSGVSVKKESKLLRIYRSGKKWDKPRTTEKKVTRSTSNTPTNH